MKAPGGPSSSPSPALISSKGEIIPDLVRRACGGWLAVAPRDAQITVAVTANTADEAKEQFRSTIRRWVEVLSGEAWCLALVNEFIDEVAIEEDPATLDLMVAYALGG